MSDNKRCCLLIFCHSIFASGWLQSRLLILATNGHSNRSSGKWSILLAKFQMSVRIAAKCWCTMLLILTWQPHTYVANAMPQGAVNFALKLAQLEGGSPVDYNTITDLFLQVFPSLVSVLFNNAVVQLHSFVLLVEVKSVNPLRVQITNFSWLSHSLYCYYLMYRIGWTMWKVCSVNTAPFIDYWIRDCFACLICSATWSERLLHSSLKSSSPTCPSMGRFKQRWSSIDTTSNENSEAYHLEEPRSN